MRITRIHYEELQSLGGYCNRRVGVDVAVGEGESPEDALAAAREFVGRAHGRGPEDRRGYLADVVRAHGPGSEEYREAIEAHEAAERAYRSLLNVSVVEVVDAGQG